jgi:hypothetical protein
MKANKKICDGCGELTYIFKNVSDNEGRKRLCKRCSKVHAVKQGKEYKPTISKPIAFRSPKRSKEETQYNKKAKAFKEANPNCQIGIPGACTHKTHDVHHMGGKENELLLKEEWWKATCRQCHDWVTVNTQEAIDLGHSLPRTTKLN